MSPIQNWETEERSSLLPGLNLAGRGCNPRNALKSVHKAHSDGHY